MRSGYAASDDGATNDVDLSAIGRVLLKRRWWVIVPTLAAFIGALLFVNIVKPRYSADARVLLENQESFLTRADKGERIDPAAPDAEAVQSQIQLLTSRDLARRVIKKLDLQGNPEFDPLAGGMSALSRVLVLLGIARDPTRMSPEDRILEGFSQRLAVLSPTKTRVLSVEFTSRDPDLAARAANAVAETYIEMQQEAKRANARAAAQSLATFVADLKTRVAQAEARVEAFRARAGLLIGSNNAVIPTQQLGELSNQFSAARAVQADAEAKAKLLREMLRQGRVGEIPDVANNETMRRIYEQRVALRAQLALESRTLLPLHPRIKELTAQLANLDAQWRAAADGTARTLENDARIAASRVENLQRALDDQKRIAGAAGAEEVHLRELERAAKLLKEQLETESTKYHEALARERQKATPADARIIQRALAPQIPSFPKKLPITIFATLGTLILSVGAIISGELLGVRAQIPSHRPAGREADAQPLAATAASAPPSAAAIAEPVDPAVARDMAMALAASAGMAASQADFAQRLPACVKVLVTPCGGDEKLDDTAIALGRNLARRGRALLVAADRGAARFDALAPRREGGLKGLSDILAGETAFCDAIHRDASSRLHVMPGGVSGEEERCELEFVVDALVHTYDFVVFAASPAQARRLAPLVDMAFVIGGDEAESLREELARAGVDAFLLEDGVDADDLFPADSISAA